MGFFKEFKEFITRGNVIDLAVGVIIGAAFTAIINSLVADIIMPIIGIIAGGVDFSNLMIHIGSAQIRYGAFINAIINFLLIAFVLFMIVKSFNKLNRKDAAPAKKKTLCPFCYTEINEKATVCPNCTEKLEGIAKIVS